MTHQDGLPDAQSPDLHLDHPTPEECRGIWTNAHQSWGDSLSLPEYLRECAYLTSVPLAKESGMTNWILVDKNLEPNQRQILSSCESFRKLAVASDAGANTETVVVHGIASVFCAQELRGRGYAGRIMKEMAKVLREWQSDGIRVAGSILFSDIGKVYYAKLGWKPAPENRHVDLFPFKGPNELSAKAIVESDLEDLCAIDMVMVRRNLASPLTGTDKRLSILPSLDHMLWHISKEDFACKILFGKVPQAKGAVAGPPGHRVWAIWTHRYLRSPRAKGPSKNTLYILRIVVEDADGVGKVSADDHASHLEAVLVAAQAEAQEWQLDIVQICDPPPWVQKVITDSQIEHVMTDRQEENIASGFWYDEDGASGAPPLWINREHYLWC